MAAVRRYRWLMVAIVVVSTLAGFGATRFLTPQFEVQARILIEADSPMDTRAGPIRSTGLLVADDWSQLLRSFTIADAVIRKLSLYLSSRPKDADVFAGFSVADRFTVARYELDIDRDRKRWTLKLASGGTPIDSGAMTDSVGRAGNIGFLWRLQPTVFDGTGSRRVGFTVSTPREAAVKLINRLSAQRSPTSNFIRLSFEDPDAQLASQILNTWVDEYVRVAAVLKSRKLSELTRRVEGQLQTAKSNLDAAEDALQSFRVKTITKPSENAPIAAGLQETRDPVINAYFAKSIEFDEVKRDIALLRTLIANLANDSVPQEALLQIRSVAAPTPVTQALRTAVQDYHTAQGKLSTARLAYTDEHPIVRDLLTESNSLRREKIPRLANELLSILRMREVDDSTRLASMGTNLQQIPQRTIDEERLRRARDLAAGLFTNLQNRHAEARLAEASATPDVSVLDSAIAPLQPTKNTAPKVILIAIVGGIAAALGLAIVLDMLDGKFRYPEQATDDLGLPIAGTVPQFPKGGINQNSPEQTYQLVESFRSLRMAVIQAAAGRTVSIAVSSPSPADGKSLISANLAMSFADAGLRTVLVDGDTRRGLLHEMFELPNAPGLTDYLSGAASLSDIIQSTGHSSLSIVAGGVRRRRSPELLASPRLLTLVDELRAKYNVVIFDTPPLAAGVDGYSIATATGSLLVVLRVGKTARRMAAEKLRLFDRLPVDIVGAVLNGIQMEGSYSYYGYVPGYAAEDESEETQLAKVT